MYLSSVVLANLAVTWFGPAASIVTAFLAIGFSITGRDALHDIWRGKHLKRNMALLIAAGSGITVLLNAAAWRVALASTVAFALSMLVDSLVYHPTRDITLSNVASSAVDSVLFPWLAFGGFMPLITLGQFAAKVGGGILWMLLLRLRK